MLHKAAPKGACSISAAESAAMSCIATIWGSKPTASICPSDTAVQVACEWGRQKALPEPEQRIRQGDIRRLPWDNGFFRYAVSHGVLDSMPFEIARAASVELARVMPVDGLFYCDLISGDDSRHAREFSGEELVTTAHEQGTIQLYFNLAKIEAMIDGVFEIDECNLIRRENVLRGGFASRYHLVLRRR